jgi:hypothetical protein
MTTDSMDYQAGWIGNSAERKMAFTRKKSVEDLIDKLATGSSYVTRTRQPKSQVDK